MGWPWRVGTDLPQYVGRFDGVLAPIVVSPNSSPLLKLFSRLTLTLLLLLGQQGAMLHELSHFAESDFQQAHGHDSHTVGGFCAVCLAFSQVGTAALPEVQAPGLLAGLAFQALFAPQTPMRPHDVPSRRSRDPPNHL